MAATLSPPRRRVAVADDNPEFRRQKAQVLKIAGYEPVPLDDRYPLVEDLIKAVEAVKAEGLVCDHKLTEGAYAGFMGVEAVAAMYERKTPALLVTDYAETDLQHSIRPYRKRVPVLIPGQSFEPRMIVSGFAAWEREVVDKELPVARRPRRAFVHIEEVFEGPNGRMFTVRVPRWQEHTAVQIPAALMAADLARRLSKGSKVIASVNTEAQRAEDLYFDDFEELPKGEPDEKA